MLMWILALLYLYSAGYLHRDISDGNIIYCDGIGKISDLEYAIAYMSNVDASTHAAKSVKLGSSMLILSEC